MESRIELRAGRSVGVPSRIDRYTAISLKRREKERGERIAGLSKFYTRLVRDKRRDTRIDYLLRRIESLLIFTCTFAGYVEAIIRTRMNDQTNEKTKGEHGKK